MAQAYRKAAVEICAPDGNIPMLRGGTVALALARSAWHFSQALAVAWRLYRAPADGVWQGLHRVNRFATEVKLDTRAVADPLAGGSAEIRVLYLRALLMAVTHPLAFSQSEQDLLWQVTADMATRCTLVRCGGYWRIHERRRDQLRRRAGRVSRGARGVGAVDEPRRPEPGRPRRVGRHRDGGRAGRAGGDARRGRRLPRDGRRRDARGRADAVAP